MRLLYNQLCGCVIELFVKPLWFRFNRLRQLSHFRHEINILFFLGYYFRTNPQKGKLKKKRSSIPKSSEPSTNSKSPEKSPRFGKNLSSFAFPIFVYLLDHPNLSNLVFDSARTCRNRLCIDSASIQYQPIGIREFLSELSSFVNQFKG